MTRTVWFLRKVCPIHGFQGQRCSRQSRHLLEPVRPLSSEPLGKPVYLTTLSCTNSQDRAHRLIFVWSDCCCTLHCYAVKTGRASIRTEAVLITNNIFVSNDKTRWWRRGTDTSRASHRMGKVIDHQNQFDIAGLITVSAELSFFRTWINHGVFLILKWTKVDRHLTWKIFIIITLEVRRMGEIFTLLGCEAAFIC